MMIMSDQYSSSPGRSGSGGIVSSRSPKKKMEELQVPNYNHLWIKRTMMNWARRHLFSLISILSIFHSLSFFFPNCISKISSSLQILLININDHHDLYHHLESFLSMISTINNPRQLIFIYRPPILDLLVILITLFLFLSFRLRDQYWKYSNYNTDMKKPMISAAAAAAAGRGEYDIEINYHGISGRKVELASSSYLLDYKYCFPSYDDTNTATTTTTTTTTSSCNLFAVSDHHGHEFHNIQTTNELSQQEYDGNPAAAEECFEFGGDHQAAAEKIIGEDMIIGRSRRREARSSTTHINNTSQQQQLSLMLSEDLAIIPAAEAAADHYIDQEFKILNLQINARSSSLISSSSSSYIDKMVMVTADDATARKKKSSRKQLPRSRITTSTLIDSASSSSSSSTSDHDHQAAAAASKTINSGTTDHQLYNCRATGGLISTTDHQYCPVNHVPSNSVVYLNRQPKLSDVLAASTPTLRNCSNNYNYNHNHNYEDIFMLEEELDDRNHDQYSYCKGSTSCCCGGCRVVDVDQQADDQQVEAEDSSTDHDDQKQEMISMEQTWWMITGSGNSNSTAVGRPAADHGLIITKSSAKTELPSSGKKNKMQNGGGTAGHPATTAVISKAVVLDHHTSNFKDHHHEAVSRWSVPALMIRPEKSMGLEELHKRAEAFISKMREDIQLQRQESYRFFMDMMNRSVHSS